MCNLVGECELVVLLLSYDEGAEVEPRAVEFLLFDAIIILKFPFDQSEQLLIIFLHDVINLSL